jgi:ABC-type uncharacterized transport system ATPase subunit
MKLSRIINLFNHIQTKEGDFTAENVFFFATEKGLMICMNKMDADGKAVKFIQHAIEEGESLPTDPVIIRLDRIIELFESVTEPIEEIKVDRH